MEEINKYICIFNISIQSNIQLLQCTKKYSVKKFVGLIYCNCNYSKQNL